MFIYIYRWRSGRRQGAHAPRGTLSIGNASEAERRWARDVRRRIR